MIRPAYMTSTRSQKVGDEVEVVTDEHQTGAAPVDEFVEDGQHLPAHRHVEGGGRLVGDDQVGFGDQHHGNHDALAHAARDFVRQQLKHPIGIADLDRFQHGERPFAAPRFGLRDVAAGRLR